MIKNVVFDLGNVIVKWVPSEVIKSNFPDKDIVEFWNAARPLWLDLNLGKLSEAEATEIYAKLFDVTKARIEKLLLELKTSQVFVEGMYDLISKLDSHGIPLYSITDNVKEIVDYHYKHSNFLHHFKGIVTSCDEGIMKPNTAIYKTLLDRYSLNANETVFVDDMDYNVKGAKDAGMHAFQFENAIQCELKLTELELLDKHDHFDEL